MAPHPLPLDLGSIGDSVTSVAGDAADAATGAAETATSAAAGAVETATSAAAGAVETATSAAAGAAATASAAVSSVVSDGEDAAAMIKMLNKIEGYIDTIEDYWTTYKNLIIFIFALIVTIYVLSILYCCYHCCHDFFRCCCCYIKCTYHCERWCWRHRGPCVRCCKSCLNAHDKQDFHRCSRACLKAVPKKIRDDLEKQHGDLKRGWQDPTYCARACGRYELPEDPVERAKWHWWGHEEGWAHKVVLAILECMGKTIDKEKRLAKELSSAAGRDEHWSRLVEQATDTKGRVMSHSGELKRRVNREWAERKELLSVLKTNLSAAEKKAEDRLLKRAAKRSREEIEEKSGWDSDDTAVESDDEKPRNRGGRV